DELHQRLSRLSTSVAALRRTFPELTEDQAVAIAQHYSTREKGVSTWLLDVKRDPPIPLFFPSDPCLPRKSGGISALKEMEWKRLSGDGTNRLGAIREVDLPTVGRIQAQKGLFLDTSHPQLFSAYSPFRLEFVQTGDLAFEDPFRDPPITRDCLYQKDC